jgi:hypothetical protein
MAYSGNVNARPHRKLFKLRAIPQTQDTVFANLSNSGTFHHRHQPRQPHVSHHQVYAAASPYHHHSTVIHHQELFRTHTSGALPISQHQTLLALSTGISIRTPTTPHQQKSNLPRRATIRAVYNTRSDYIMAPMSRPTLCRVSCSEVLPPSIHANMATRTSRCRSTCFSQPRRRLSNAAWPWKSRSMHP